MLLLEMLKLIISKRLAPVCSKTFKNPSINKKCKNNK